jgi:hypothetical protein
MIANPETPHPDFARWDADDALDALHLAGLGIDNVEQARWPASAPQPRTHRQAFTFRSPDAVDPHLLLVFETPEDLEAWRLWLARYWKARPYLSIRDNVLLLVSRDLPQAAAVPFHQALARLGEAAQPEATPAPDAPTASAPQPAPAPQAAPVAPPQPGMMPGSQAAVPPQVAPAVQPAEAPQR